MPFRKLAIYTIEIMIFKSLQRVRYIFFSWNELLWDSPACIVILPFSIRVFDVQPQNVVWDVMFVKIGIHTKQMS